MSEDFIKTIGQLIRPVYHLERDGKKWMVKESHSSIGIRFPNNVYSIGFSLDHSDSKCDSKCDSKPFAFFSDHPPRDFAKMCDAFIFCFHENNIYLFIIEVKTGHKGDYQKQLINGKLFCDWLISLCKHHKFPDSSVTLVPLLIWQPRHNSPHEGMTTHCGEGITKEVFEQFSGNGFEISNRDSVAIIELISYLEK